MSRWLRRFTLGDARAAINAHGNLAPDGRPAHHPFLVAIIIDGVMLSCGIVPHCEVARIPAPADRIFEPGDMGLEHFEQAVRIRLRIADEAANKAP
jgi:hypothetical protein